ncbi:MAG TPA: DUF3857 domain-containing protein [Candidatus Polarisedimenticolaceae bacterium]|nr:DUF3857 domain-containing protein [Candidatus Polarisedimenticolaceae bacterium]
MKRVLRCGLTVAAGLLAGRAAQAAKLPEWAAPLANAASGPEAGVPKHAQRVLLSDLHLVVQPDGTLKIRRRLAVQVLSARADDVDFAGFDIDGSTTVTRARGWHVAPGEKAERSLAVPVEVTLDPSFLTDQKTRVVALSGVKKGSLLFYEFEAVDKPPTPAYRHLFFERGPIARAHLDVETPPGWQVHHAWLRTGDAAPTIAGNQHSWELNDLPFPDAEPLARTPVEQAPLLVLAFQPPAGTVLAAPVFGDWKDLAAWYEALEGDRGAASPEVAAEARALAGSPEAAAFARIRAAGSFVRDRVRYVAREVGIGGYQPRPAGQVLRELVGDCKDKSTLLRALLAAEGLPSYPVLIHATAADTVPESLPSLTAFNHFVVAVPLPADAGLPADAAFATLDAGELGRLLVVDTTDDRHSVGFLPAALGGKKGLLVAGSRSRLLTLPGTEPRAHRVEQRLEVRAGDGPLALRLESRFYGEPAAEARAAYRESSRDRRREIESRLVERFVSTALDEYSVEAEAEDGAYVETLSWKLDPAALAAQHRLVPLFPGALDDLPRVPLGRRQAALRYAYPLALSYETRFVGAPAHQLAPDDQHLEGSGWSVGTHFTREGSELRASWQLALSRVDFARADFEELKRFWSAAGRAAAPAVALEP